MKFFDKRHGVSTQRELEYRDDINNRLMMTGRVVAVLLLLTIVTAKVSLTNLGIDFAPQDELEYANFLKLILGRHDESTSLSPALTQFAAQYRPSLANALEQVALVFMPLPAGEQLEGHSEFQLQGKVLKELVSGTPSLFTVTYLPATEKALLEGLVSKFQAQNKAVHVIRGDETELKRMSELLNPEAPVKSTSRRLQKKQNILNTPLSGSYLLKFFFSLLFIIVIVGIVSFIASNEGKKDTLLYAKFIADVGIAR